MALFNFIEYSAHFEIFLIGEDNANFFHMTYIDEQIIDLSLN